MVPQTYPRSVEGLRCRLLLEQTKVDREQIRKDAKGEFRVLVW